MKRRDLLLASAAATGAAMLPRFAFAEAGRLDVYTSSDVNISDFWANSIIPGFQAANPGITINWVDAGDGAGLAAIADRALAALQSKTDPQSDVYEGFDPHLPKGGIEAGLWTDFSKANLANYSKINPLAIQTPYGFPYRGSQVLLAYDTTKLKPADAPKTWDALVTWMKANPGQFIYNRPDKGGAGGNFVRRAIHQANGLDPAKFTIDNFTPEYAEETLSKTWTLLNDIGSSMYQNGGYTAGSTQSIQLLAQGVVTMTSVWSDQVLQAISQGVLPETTGLVQLTDLALCGGFTQIAVPTNAANQADAMKLLDYLLTEEVQTSIITDLGGFPGVTWENVSKELHDKYADIIPTTIPTFPGGDWDGAINDGWYRNVAPSIDRNAA